MERPYSVVRLETHRRQSRPADAAGTPWWDRHKLDLDQPESSETERQDATGLAAPKTGENGADSHNTPRRRIFEPKVLLRSLVKPELTGLAAIAVGPPQRSFIPSTFNHRDHLRRKLSRAVTTRFAWLDSPRQHMIRSAVLYLESDTK